jgi:hypothetical protein
MSYYVRLGIFQPHYLAYGLEVVYKILKKAVTEPQSSKYSAFLAGRRFGKTWTYAHIYGMGGLSSDNNHKVCVL